MTVCFAAVVVRPIQKEQQRRMKEDEIAAEQKAHETELLANQTSSKPLRN